jgi:hypothetical protein
MVLKNGHFETLIIWTERVRNEEVLQRFKQNGNILQAIQKEG